MRPRKLDSMNGIFDVLEAKPRGRLLKCDPKTGKTSLLLDNLAFANGVALSPEQDFLVVCQSWKFRCLKLWLTGKQRTEVFMDNLPGAPDNINVAPDGTFCIALIEWRSGGYKEFIHKSKLVKRVIAKSSALFHWIFNTGGKAMVINVDVNGKIIDCLDDSTGKVMSFVTSALEFEDHLYLGNLNTNFIGKLRLQKAKK